MANSQWPLGHSRQASIHRHSQPLAIDHSSALKLGCRALEKIPANHIPAFFSHRDGWRIGSALIRDCRTGAGELALGRAVRTSLEYTGYSRHRAPLLVPDIASVDQ